MASSFPATSGASPADAEAVNVSPTALGGPTVRMNLVHRRQRRRGHRNEITQLGRCFMPRHSWGPRRGEGRGRTLKPKISIAASPHLPSEEPRPASAGVCAIGHQLGKAVAYQAGAPAPATPFSLSAEDQRREERSQPCRVSLRPPVPLSPEGGDTRATRRSDWLSTESGWPSSPPESSYRYDAISSLTNCSSSSRVNASAPSRRHFLPSAERGGRAAS